MAAPAHFPSRHRFSRQRCDAEIENLNLGCQDNRAKGHEKVCRFNFPWPGCPRRRGRKPPRGGGIEFDCSSADEKNNLASCCRAFQFQLPSCTNSADPAAGFLLLLPPPVLSRREKQTSSAAFCMEPAHYKYIILFNILNLKILLTFHLNIS